MLFIWGYHPLGEPCELMKNVGPGCEFQGWLSKAAWPHAIWGSKYIKPPFSSDMNITGHINININIIQYIYIYTRQCIYIYICIYIHIYIYINYSYNYIQLWNDTTDNIPWNSKKWSRATSFFSEALICWILIHSLGGEWACGLPLISFLCLGNPWFGNIWYAIYWLDWFSRENLQETIDFPMKIMGLSCRFSLKPIHWYMVYPTTNPSWVWLIASLL